jgi:COP9 signalosome complex subunit 5
MLKHALSGCEQVPAYEVMGFLHGKAFGRSFFITDAIPFPVQGSETRVTASEECMEGLINHNDVMRTLGRTELAVGWYHSHPGLTCYLSNIDVMSQRQNATVYGAFVALVIDPLNTASSGRIHLGAFWTYPPNQKPSRRPTEEERKKYGIAAEEYCELEIKYFKTETDVKVLSDMVTRSYAKAIACSPLRLNANYIGDKVKDSVAHIESLLKGNLEELNAVEKTINRVNEDRRSGIWIERMRRAAFG